MLVVPLTIVVTMYRHARRRSSLEQAYEMHYIQHRMRHGARIYDIRRNRALARWEVVKARLPELSAARRRHVVATAGGGVGGRGEAVRRQVRAAGGRRDNRSARSR